MTEPSVLLSRMTLILAAFNLQWASKICPTEPCYPVPSAALESKLTHVLLMLCGLGLGHTTHAAAFPAALGSLPHTLAGPGYVPQMVPAPDSLGLVLHVVQILEWVPHVMHYMFLSIQDPQCTQYLPWLGCAAHSIPFSHFGVHATCPGCFTSAVCSMGPGAARMGIACCGSSMWGGSGRMRVQEADLAVCHLSSLQDQMSLTALIYRNN